MISSAIWNRKAGVPQTASSFQIAREKSLDYVMIIYMKKTRYIIIMQKKSARFKCKNNLFKLCKCHCAFGQNNRVRSKIIYNDIFTSLRRKKVQIPAKQFKELFSLVCYCFALN